MRETQTLARVQALLDARRFAEAAPLLVTAAASGDAAAMSELAQWRIAGNVIRRDLAAARRLLERSAEQGDAEAALLHVSFLASGVGGPADFAAAVAALRRLAPREARARRQLRLIEAMEIDADGRPVGPIAGETISRAPEAAVCRGFMTAAECDYLCLLAEPVIQPSMVVDPSSGRLIPHPIRTSEGAMFGVHSEDVAVNALNRRIAAFSGTHPAQGEPLQLLRYRPGAEYKAHMDGLPAEPNQRILTVLVYLSDDYEGGETCFLKTGLRFKGGKGDALLFRNAGPDGRPDPLSLHAGLPVSRGTKLIASRWIRQSTFTYPPPRPILDL